MGTTEFGDKKNLETLANDLKHLSNILSHHAEQEEKHFHPFIQTKIPEVVKRLHEAHEALEDEFDQIAIFANRVFKEENDKERIPQGLKLYQALNLFIAHYLEHLHEEEETMPLIWEQSTDEELLQVIKAFHANADPQLLEGSLNYLFPAIPQTDREVILQDIKMNAAAHIYQRVLGIYDSCK